jgi:hypothetical protein
MPEPLYIQESFVNLTEGYRFGDSDVYEAFTSDRSKLYKSLVREYGRCTGKVYIDLKPTPAGPNAMPVGWVFVKRMKYEDCDKAYLREVWVTLHPAPPTKKTEYHYATL